MVVSDNLKTELSQLADKLDFASLIPYLDRADMFGFDLDGTLDDGEEHAVRKICQGINNIIRKHFGNQPEWVPSIGYGAVAGTPLSGIMDMAARECNIPFTEEMPTFDQPVRQEMEAEVLRVRADVSVDETRLIKPIAAFLHFLWEQNKPICLITASESGRAAKIIEALGLGYIFKPEEKDQWLFSSELSAKEGTYVRAKRTLERKFGKMFDPQRCIGIEDSPGAIKAGCKARFTIIPHNLCTHVPDKHKRLNSLQTAKAAGLNDPENGMGQEFRLAKDGVTRKLVERSSDVRVIRWPNEVLIIIQSILGGLHERPEAVSRDAIFHQPAGAPGQGVN